MPRRNHPKNRRPRFAPTDTEPDTVGGPNSIDWEQYVFNKVRAGEFNPRFLTRGLKDTST